MMCEVMPTINEDTPMSQRGSQSSGSDSDSHFEQLMVNMLDERDRLLDTLRETQESLSLAQQRLQDVIYDRDSLQRQLNSALPQRLNLRFNMLQTQSSSASNSQPTCALTPYLDTLRVLIDEKADSDNLLDIESELKAATVAMDAPASIADEGFKRQASPHGSPRSRQRLAMFEE
ncbi:Liprin-alpha-2 [Saguinus oedipus]|uniref:Liprin-alpha-2 n=1 Tax=Saguinus oedipus TaxID=9490 RepID=A0ABQ9UZ24_SAGOE|nr:Liprin-alpha-2 [Saguinus oedipus]